MTERSIFLAALEYDDPAERSAYLDRTCAGEPALRAQVEQLLTAHEQSGSFMSRPAPERLAGCPATSSDEALRTSPAAGDGGEGLDFLDPSDTPGSLGRLGHYEVQEIVGRGGMGVVLRAFDETLRRVVAVKVMARQLAASATARRRFSREARATAAVAHDHVVTVYAVEDAGPLPYIVMQYVAGRSLQERLDRTGPLPLAEILRIGMQTAAGLAAAHAQGLVHRDVKPANILLENGVERVKLTDFGLARAADDASLTQSGTVAGTPLFMSPEQAEGRPVDQRSDLFSLGSVLYTLCTGRPPFRAGTSMGVLKRVCEDAPTPIREINPEVPDWLAAVVGRLHAKDPAGRFQTAAEVADLLGQLLAHVQHPAVAPLPAAVRPAEEPPASPRPGGRRRRWMVGAAVVVTMFAALGAAEATGVTKVRATVTRIFTPRGTLVVETDDPDVKVTVEGDGGLVIAGAGPQEVRLRPGSYRLRATKDGKPAALDRDLVTITRGDKQIVRVRLEEETPAAAAAKAEHGAFVLLATGTERKFDTLAEAVLNAADGDTIEVHGNGPFVTTPISARSTALTIRAAPGFRPVIRLENGDRVPAPLLRTDSALVLEGLDLERHGEPTAPVAEHVILYSDRASLHVGNCRLAIRGLNAVTCIGSPRCVLRNCELAIPQAGGVDWFQPARGELELDNCIILRPLQPVLGLHYADPPAEEPVDVSVRLRRNTWVSGGVWWLACERMKAGAGLKPVRVEATANLFAVGRMVDIADYRRDRTPLTRAEALGFLPRLINWRGRENVYPQRLADWVQWFASVSDAPRIKDLTEWGTFWGDKEIASSQARIRYQGGDLHAKAATSPESIAPEDCRLRPDSAGYRAGKDGKDLGADVDLVGPGAAYERWKRTPDYRQWLKDTGQPRAEVPEAEPNAFVLLGGKGVAERRFDTLAEAVLTSTDGDTIEVRGNGPFVTGPIRVSNHALVLRAGAGYRPVIRLSPEGAQTYEPLLQSNAPLTVEGLELHRFGQKPWKEGHPVPCHIYATGPSLFVAHCGFRADAHEPFHDHIRGHTAECRVRGCVFIAPSLGAAVDAEACQTLVLDNCLHLGTMAVGIGAWRAGKDDVRLVMNRNTLITGTFHAIHYAYSPAVQPVKPGEATRRIKAEAAGNLIDGAFVLNAGTGTRKASDSNQAEALLRRVFAWNGRGNLYHLPDRYVYWTDEKSTGPLPVGGLRNLDEWKKFWGSPETGSVVGMVRYQGGDLLARLVADPLRITPEDFRLRPDSAGYRAGKDGKDLGADVDLVGPGAAYERWRQTPDYRQWLEDTRQVKK